MTSIAYFPEKINDNSQPGGADESRLDQKLSRRGILEVARAAGWQPDRNGWVYPVGSVRRFKNADSSAKPKYAWQPGKPADVKYYLPFPEALAEGIRAARGELYIVNGEPGVLTMVAAGLENALCWFGEPSIPDTLAADLVGQGVSRALYIADNDDKGRQAAAKTRDALAGSGIDFEARSLAGLVPEKGDVNDLWIALQFDRDRFAAALAELPPLELPARAPVKIQPRAQDYAGDDFPEDFVRAVIRALENQPGAKYHGDWLNCCSPFREETNPSFGFNVKGLGWNDFGGKSGGIIELGQALGIELQDYRDPVIHVDKHHCHKVSERKTPVKRLTFKAKYFTAPGAPPLEGYLEPGVYVLKGIQGTGKTELLTRIEAQHQAAGHITRVITPTRALTGDNVRRMDTESQLALYPDKQIIAPHLTLTLPSIIHQVNELGQLREIDALYLTEGEALLQAVFYPIYKDKRSAIFNTLCEAIRRAKWVYVDDADAGPVMVNFLLSLRENITLVENTYQPPRRRMLTYEYKYDALAALERHLADGPDLPTAVACAAKADAEALADQFSHLRVMLITSKTRNLESVKAFLRHPDGNMSGVDLLVYTGAMGSGVDLTATRFSAMFGIFPRNPIDAYACRQMLLRARNAEVYHVWVDPTQQRLITDPDHLKARWQRRRQKTAEAARYIFNGTGVDLALEANRQMLELRAQVAARRNRSRVNLRGHFLHLTQDLFEITAGAGIGSEAAQAMKAASARAGQEREDALYAEAAGALPIDSDTYQQAVIKDSVTPALEAGHLRWCIEQTYGEAITRQTFDHYRHGGAARLELFERTLKPVDISRADDLAELGARMPELDMGHHTQRRALVNAALKTFAIDNGLLADGQPHVWELEALEPAWEAALEGRGEDLALYLSWRHDQSPTPKNQITHILRHVGLSLKEVRRRDGIKRYQLDPEKLLDMLRWTEQRQALQKSVIDSMQYAGAPV